MIDGLRYFLARYVVHFLKGMTFGDWWRLRRKHYFVVSPSNWPRVALQGTLSLTNSINRLGGLGGHLLTQCLKLGAKDKNLQAAEL